MNVLRLILTVFVMLIYSVAAHAGWDQQCVETCVNTHHACNYCDYQCWRDDVDKPEYDTGDSYRCPLQGYE